MALALSAAWGAPSAASPLQPAAGLTLKTSTSLMAVPTGLSRSTALARDSSPICPPVPRSATYAPDQAAPTTLAELVERARLNNPDVARALAQIRKARADVETVTSAYSPTLRVGANTGAQNGTGKSGLAAAANAQLSKLLHDFGKTDNLIEEARMREEARMQEHLDTIDRIVLDITETWLNAARQSEMLRLHQEAAAALDEAVRILVLRADAGLVGSGDVELARARVLQVRAAGVAACVQREQLLSRLSLLSGGPAGEPARAPLAIFRGNGPTQPWEPSLLPALRQAEAEHRAAISHAQSVKASRWPSIYLQATRTTSGGSNQQPASNAINVALNVDLLEPGTESRIDSAGADVQAALLHIQSLRQSAEDTLRRTRSELAGLETRQPLLQLQAQSTAATRRTFMDQFLAGRRPVLDLLNTHQEVLSADIAVSGIGFDRMLLIARLHGLHGELAGLLAAQPDSVNAPSAQPHNLPGLSASAGNAVHTGTP